MIGEFAFSFFVVEASASKVIGSSLAVDESVLPVLSDLLEPPVSVVHVVQVPQVQIMEKTVEIPEIQTNQDTRTSKSLGAAHVRRVDFADTEDVVEFEPPLAVVIVPPTPVTIPMIGVPPVVVEYVQRAPVVEFVSSAPTVSCAAPALAVT